MKKILAAIWRFLWPDCGMMFGLLLILDNWGHNHSLLIVPGIVLFMRGLESFIKKVTKGERL